MRTNNLIKLAIFVFIASFILSCKKDDEVAKLGSQSTYDQQILNEINKHRKSKGLAELVNNDVIWKYANEHSKNMAKGTVPFSHDGFNERSDKIQKELGKGATAENVAYGQKTAEYLVQRWLSSSGHRQNIEGDFQLTGISSVQDAKGTWYYTQIFLAKKN